MSPDPFNPSTISWAEVLDRHDGSRPPGHAPVPADASEAFVLAHLAGAGHRVQLARRLLALGSRNVDGADVMVLGSADGAELAWIAAIGAASVTDVHAKDPVPDRRQHVLDLAVRRADALEFPEPPEPTRIRLITDDITASSLPDGSTDVIMSWHALEHVGDPGRAVHEMSRLLRPGGVMVHEYTPFFSVVGGGAPEAPWEHVHHHVREQRETHAPLAHDEPATGPTLRPNRWTQRQMLGAIEAAGLELKAWLPHTRTEDLLQLPPALLEDCGRTDPPVTVVDLVSRLVRLVAARPG